jgi:hypothetical protein
MGRKAPERRVGQVIFFKKCPKCRGDLIFEEDWYHEELVCLQCGFHGPATAETMGQTTRKARR